MSGQQKFKPGDRVEYVPTPGERCHPKLPGARGYIGDIPGFGEAADEVLFIRPSGGYFGVLGAEPGQLRSIPSPRESGKFVRTFRYAERLPATRVNLVEVGNGRDAIFTRLVISLRCTSEPGAEMLPDDSVLTVGEPRRNADRVSRQDNITAVWYDVLYGHDEWTGPDLELAVREVLRHYGYPIEGIEIEVVAASETPESK